MMKTKKEKKEKKEKNTAQVTVTDYDNAVMMTNFIVEIQKKLEKTSGLSEVRFVPKMDGYRVYYKADGKDYKIAIDKKILTNGFSVKKYVDGFRKVSVGLKDAEDYEVIIAKLFGYKTEKKTKKKG